MAAVLAVEVLLVAPEFSAVLTALSAARPGWLALAVLAEAGSLSMFAATRRRLLAAAGVAVPAGSTLAAVYEASALTLTLPGGSAFSTAYTYRWMRNRGASVPAATWVLVTGGLISSAALGGLGLLGSLGAGSGAGLVPLVLGLLGVAVRAVAVRRLARRPDRVVAAGRVLLGWVNKATRRPPARGVAALDDLVGQLRSVRPSGRDWAVAGGFMLGNWVLDAACLAAGAAALGVAGLSWPLLLIAYTAGMAASGLSLLPGGIGIVDAALVLTLVAGDVPAASALPAVLLYRLISLGGVAAAGWTVAAVQARRGSRSS